MYSGERILFSAYGLLIGVCLLIGLWRRVAYTGPYPCRFTRYFFDEYKVVPIPGMKDTDRYSLKYYCASGDCTYGGVDSSPVLYVPGSMGSFKSISSLAATQYFLKQSRELHYFTIDFKQEPSGLSGNMIERQTTFLKRSIDVILNLYTVRRPAGQSSSSSSRSIPLILVSHSMGSVVVQNLLTNRVFDRSKIVCLISLSGPSFFPVISPGPVMERIYHGVAAFYDSPSRVRSVHPVPQLGIVGSSDFLVPKWLTDIGQNRSHVNHIHWIDVASLQHTWLTCDHLTILWCRQLMIQLAKLVRDISLLVAKAKPSGSYMRAIGDPDAMMDLFKTHTYSRMLSVDDDYDDADDLRAEEGALPLLTTGSRKPPIREEEAEWIDLSYRSHMMEHISLPKTTTFLKLGPFFVNNSAESVLITSTQFSGASVFLCNSTEVTDCSNLIPIHLSSSWPPEPPVNVAGFSVQFTWIPFTEKFGSKAVLFLKPLHGGYDYTTLADQPNRVLVLRYPKTTIQDESRMVDVTVDVIDKLSDRLHSIDNLQSTWSTTFNLDRVAYPDDSSYSSSCLHCESPANQTSPVSRSDGNSGSPFSSTWHRLRLAGSQLLPQSWSLPVPSLVAKVEQCGGHVSNREFPGVMIAHYDSVTGNQRIQEPMRRGTSSILHLELPPSSPVGGCAEDILIDLFIESGCSYSFSFNYSWTHWLFQLLGLHWSHVSGLLAGHLLICLMHPLVIFLWLNFLSRRRLAFAPSSPPSIPCANGNCLPAADESVSGGKDDQISGSVHLRVLNELSLHLIVGLGHFIALQFDWWSVIANSPSNEWLALFKHGTLGLRLADTTPTTTLLATSLVPSSVAWAAFSPFLLLSLVPALLVPISVRLVESLIALGMEKKKKPAVGMVQSPPSEEEAHKEDLPSTGLGRRTRIGFLLGLFASQLVTVLLFYPLGIALQAVNILVLAASIHKERSSNYRLARRLALRAGLVLVVISMMQLESWVDLIIDLMSGRFRKLFEQPDQWMSDLRNNQWSALLTPMNVCLISWQVFHMVTCLLSSRQLPPPHRRSNRQLPGILAGLVHLVIGLAAARYVLATLSTVIYLHRIGSSLAVGCQLMLLLVCLSTVAL